MCSLHTSVSRCCSSACHLLEGTDHCPAASRCDLNRSYRTIGRGRPHTLPSQPQRCDSGQHPCCKLWKHSGRNRTSQTRWQSSAGGTVWRCSHIPESSFRCHWYHRPFRRGSMCQLGPLRWLCNCRIAQLSWSSWAIHLVACNFGRPTRQQCCSNRKHRNSSVHPHRGTGKFAMPSRCSDCGRDAWNR